MMKTPLYTLTINADTAEEMIQAALDLKTALGSGSPLQDHAPTGRYPGPEDLVKEEGAAAPLDHSDPPPQVEDPAKRRGRLPKTRDQKKTVVAQENKGRAVEEKMTREAQAEATPTFQDDAGADLEKPFDGAMPNPPPKPPLPQNPVTMQDMATALQRVVQKEGLGFAKAKEILGQFGAASLSGVKQEDFYDFVIACEKAMR